jgi:hypothetical protein
VPPLSSERDLGRVLRGSRTPGRGLTERPAG